VWQYLSSIHLSIGYPDDKRTFHPQKGAYSREHLRLDGSADAGLLGDGANLADNALAVRDTSLAVAGKLEYKEPVKIEFFPLLHLRVSSDPLRAQSF
jgi:hypothetical protein